ncbi:MAG: sialidase [Verrucomicrobiales bacterium]|nr:sialidase [Verrucomicrobiales bacterium]
MKNLYFIILLLLIFPKTRSFGDEKGSVNLKIELLSSIPGRDLQWDWWQARTAFVPSSTDGKGAKSKWVTTMSETGRAVSHDFHDIFESVSYDQGRTWSKPKRLDSLRRFKQDDGYEVSAGDLWPTYHKKSGKVISTGKTFNFEKGTNENIRREKISYAVMDPKNGEWGKLRFLEMPEKDHAGNIITAVNAGNTQRVDLPNGDILLPVRYMADSKKVNYTSIVALCRFDGEKLVYLKHGTEHSIPRDRGLYEPSLIEHKGEYFLTLRADHSGFVTKGGDGLSFEKIREWTFDDGKPLESYNTQQHWISAGGSLFLIYTRRAGDNNHIFRHRAPLFIAEVDPERLCVIRNTEKVLLEENEATLGNSGVCQLGANEWLVTCGEGLLRMGKRKNEINKVLFAKVSVINKSK